MDLIEKLETLTIRQLDNELFRILSHINFYNFEYSVSVQASSLHYCSPRKTVPLNEYTHFEVMLNIPSNEVPHEWKDYVASDNVYGYVPKQLIEKLINDLDKKYKMN